MIHIKQIPEKDRYVNCEFYCNTKALYEIRGLAIDGLDDGGYIDCIMACHPHLCILSTTIEEFVNGLDLD